MILRLRYEKCNRSRHGKSNLKEDRVELCYGEFIGWRCRCIFESSKHSETFTRLRSRSIFFFKFTRSPGTTQIPHRCNKLIYVFYFTWQICQKKKKGKLRLSPMTLFIKRGNSRKFLVRGNYSPLSSREIKMSATPFAYVSIYPSSPSRKYRSNVLVWTPILKKYPVLFLK